MSEPVFEKRTETPSGKNEGKAVEKAPNADVQKCLEYLSGPFACSPDEKTQAELFLNAHIGQTKEFAKIIAFCESNNKVDWLGDNVSLPLKSSSVAELSQKPELAQLAKTGKADSNEKKADSNEKIENQKVSELVAALPSRRPDLSQKFGERLKDWESGKLSSAEKTALARDILSDLKKSFEDAKANGSDTSKAAEDLRFFATQFRDLGVIDHAEFKKLFEEPVQKSVPGQKNQETQIAATQNFSSAWDGRTFFALDRVGKDNRKFDEFVRLSPDGKTFSKEIVWKYGFSITVEPVPNETGKTAQKESELANLKNEKGRIESQAKFLEENFWHGWSKIPAPDDPKFKEYKDSVDKIAKDRWIAPDANDPKATLENVKQSLKTTYAQAIEKTSKTQSELETLSKETASRETSENERNEKNARDAVDFLDASWVSALWPKATEELLRKFNPPGTENGKITDLNKFLKNRDALAGEFRNFVTESLGRDVSSLFDANTNPPALKAGIVDLASEFKTRRFLKVDGSLDFETVGKSKTAA